MNLRSDSVTNRLEKQMTSCRLWLIVTILALTVTGISFAEEKPSTLQLDNGMQVILKPQPGSGLTAAILFVRSGSKFEAKYENGITHLLEHLLFDGTVYRSREEIDKSIRDVGGYINAFTQKDLTAYLVLVPSQFADMAMTTQTDMVFNSTVPETELAKERKVVIEEINRDADAPGAPAEEFFTDKAYANTEYDRPVLGYKAFIENIPREAIMTYWRKYYLPNNMTLLVIGDFATKDMTKLVRQIYGKAPKGTLPTREAGKMIPPVNGANRFDTVANVSSTYINFSFPAPHYKTQYYLPVDMLARYLTLDEISPLKKALVNGVFPLATEVGVSLNTYPELSRLDINVVTDRPELRDSIVTTVVGVMKSLSTVAADQSALEGIKTSVLCEDIFNSDKLHYYGFMIASPLMTQGWDFIEQYPSMLGEIDWADCKEAARVWFDNPNYIVTTVRPPVDSSEALYIPAGLTTEEVTGYFATAEFRPEEKSVRVKLDYPKIEDVPLKSTDNAVYSRTQLPNGLTVLIKQSPFSKVFGLAILGRNRTANEPADKGGITDFVNRCLEKGTTTRSAADLSRELAKIGGNLTLYDNPWIPYDDQYTTRQFSFVKLETIDKLAPQGIALVADMITNPRFDSAAVEEVRKGMMSVIGRESTSPSAVARDLYYKTLFDSSAYARPIMGTAQSIGSITIDDLRAHHRHFYAPENMILAVSTSLDTATTMKLIREQFGTLAKSNDAYAVPQPPGAPNTVKSDHTELNKEQINIYLGGVAPGAAHADAVPLWLGATILSNRLWSTLREKDGLAYSVGSGVSFDQSFGWYYSSMGTGAANYQKAFDGLLFQTDRLREEGPAIDELTTARNQVWGRLASAKLSRVNQAYYMAVDEYLGRPIGYDRQLPAKLSAVTVADVRRVVETYFRTDAYVAVTAGKLTAK